uniref:Putative reverse transcriptase domain-containing protein n=1 Tax=Tanacetum cinerariifolium TaxID=118510 RepID=A0A699HA27_TANCI|nr:putative reverse transcriptase domain-containing protein [Tanacetum cinerariifolium]
MERKIDKWEKSKKVSLEQIDKDPPPPPQAQTEYVNAVFTGSEKSNDSLNIQTQPPIIVNNKTKKDKPTNTSKKDYLLELPQQLSRVHNTFYVSNLKRCLSDESLVIPLDKLRIDDKLHFVEEPVEIMDRESKQLKKSRIPIVKVRWNSKRGLEFTWEREDQFKQKYPHLFTKITPSSSATS